jgi:biopolymer transport protein ExbD
MSHLNRMITDQVEPDLPITPMLDMSFQLLAFFIMTFRPTPVEAQIAMALPPPIFGRLDIPDVNSLSDKPIKYIVHVASTEMGTIRSMSIREDGPVAEPKEIGAEMENYFKELQSRTDQLKGKPSKLVLELEDKLLEEYVVHLLDHGIRAGFSDISPVPSNAKNR